MSRFFYSGLAYLKENNLLCHNITTDMTCIPIFLTNSKDDQFTDRENLIDLGKQESSTQVSV